MKLTNYLLIVGLVATMILSGCSKDEEDSKDSSKVTAGPPKIEVNGKTTGNIVEIPQNAMNANNGQFSGVAQSVNQVGQFLTMLNNIPTDATSTRDANAAVTYYWTQTQQEGTIEVWYTVEEEGLNYNIEYDIAVTDLVDPEYSFARTTIMSGWVAQNGANGHLVINYSAFTDGNTSFNYTYDWDTNAAGDFHVTADFNIDDTNGYGNIFYEATVFAAGNGEIDYSFTDGTNEILYHYDWNADWTIVNWTYSINGNIEQGMSGQWTA